MQMYHLCLEWKVVYPQIYLKRHFSCTHKGTKSENKEHKKTFRYILESRKSVKILQEGRQIIAVYDPIINKWENIYFCLNHTVFLPCYMPCISYVFLSCSPPALTKEAQLSGRSYLFLRIHLFAPVLPSASCHIPQQTAGLEAVGSVVNSEKHTCHLAM